MAGRDLASHLLAQRTLLLRYLKARGAADDAEDLLQELWIKLESAGPTQVDEQVAYLYRMAHNLMIDRARSSLRRRRREADFQDSDGPEQPPSAERSAMAREQLARVDELLKALGERTDYVFRRHRLELVPQREIAEELGISLSAVEKHLQKAYRALAFHRAEDGDADGGSIDAER